MILHLEHRSLPCADQEALAYAPFERLDALLVTPDAKVVD